MGFGLCLGRLSWPHHLLWIGTEEWREGAATEKDGQANSKRQALTQVVRLRGRGASSERARCCGAGTGEVGGQGLWPPSERRGSLP